MAAQNEPHPPFIDPSMRKLKNGNSERRSVVISLAREPMLSRRHIDGKDPFFLIAIGTECCYKWKLGGVNGVGKLIPTRARLCRQSWLSSATI